MSKSADKKTKKKNAPEAKPAKAKAGEKQQPAAPKGQLVAVEGARGRELEEATQRLSRALRDGDGNAGWSRWDASNTFYELRLGKAKRLVAPAKSLVLMYASDLLFRLRWEIEPALKEGRTVIAAPYVDTAVAFGLAVGLEPDWLEELFSFAPKAQVRLRIKEKAKSKDEAKKKDKAKEKDKAGKEKRPKAGSGFVEFCANSLAANSPDWDAATLRSGVWKHLDALEEKGELRRFGKKLTKQLAKK